MARAFEIDNDFGIGHTAEKHPIVYATKFYKGVCGYCEPEKWKELVKKEKKMQNKKA